MDYPSRQPTLKEAVHVVLLNRDPNFVRLQLIDWAQRYGEAFAENVRAVALPQWVAKYGRKKKI